MIDEKEIFSILGTPVTVVVDRPLGSVHPDYPDMIYPVNYGYVEGVMAPDGEEQDVYILGVNEPVDKFTGIVVGVICREDDNETKWVAVPEEKAGTEICWECNIMHAVDFTEKYFKSTLYPRYEKTSGAVLYTEKDGERRYLLVRSKSGHVGFPKGHVEFGETEREAALREISEETGLSPVLCDGFRMEYTFTTLENSVKTGAFYLARYDFAAVTKQEEEITDDWLLPFDEVYEKLNWQQDKEILKGAEEFLNS